MLTGVLIVGRTGCGSLQLDTHHRGAAQIGVGQHISTRGDALLLLDCRRALVGSSPQQQLWIRAVDASKDGPTAARAPGMQPAHHGRPAGRVSPHGDPPQRRRGARLVIGSSVQSDPLEDLVHVVLQHVAVRVPVTHVSVCRPRVPCDPSMNRF